MCHAVEPKNRLAERGLCLCLCLEKEVAVSVAMHVSSVFSIFIFYFWCLLLDLLIFCILIFPPRYIYTMCPYQNVTQRDASMLPGTLFVNMGVWRGWEVSNDRYSAMLYDDGTLCGSGAARQTKVCALHALPFQ